MKLPVLSVLGILTAFHLLLVLFTGGYRFSLIGIQVAVSTAIPSVIILLLLILARLARNRRAVGPAASANRDAAILFAAVLLVYFSNGRTMPEGDTTPARYLPLSILREGNFDLDEYRFLYAEGTPWYLLHVGGHYLSGYPVGAAVLALPFYLPSALGRVDPESRIVDELEKLAAATIVAISAVLLYLSLRLVTSRRLSLAIALVYALGTSSLSISSQALWQHGPSQLALTAAIYCLLRGTSDPRWVMWAGLPLAFALVARPLNVLIVAPMGAYIVVQHRQRLWSCALTGVLPVAFQLWYNVTYFGSPFRSQLPADIPSPFASWLWDTPLWRGLTGLLLSPGRGLFVYSPLFLLSVVGGVLAWRKGGSTLLRYLSVGVLPTVLAYGKWHFWWGGDTYGPRLLADVTPVLALFLWPVGELLGGRPAFRGAFILVAAWSIAAHSIGALYDDRHWHFCAPDNVKRLWSWTDNQLRYGAQGIVNRALMTVRRLPTSLSEPTLLSASYRVHMPPSFAVETSRQFPISLRAVNDGRAVWLAGRDATGSVWLVARWWRGDAEIAELRRMVFPCVDVLPGQSTRFRFVLNAPSVPGTYRLVLQLGSARVAWFNEADTPPAKFTVDVTAHAPG